MLIAIAVAGIVLYAIGAPDQAAEGSALGALRGGLIWVSALCGGAGAALLAYSLIRRRARRRDRG